MSLQNAGLSRGIVVPDSNGRISRTGGNQGIGRVDAHIIHWAFVTLKLVGPGVSFEVCGQHNAVSRTGDNLLEIGTENALSNPILVLSEALHKSWVSLVGAHGV